MSARTKEMKKNKNEICEVNMQLLGEKKCFLWPLEFDVRVPLTGRVDTNLQARILVFDEAGYRYR